MANIKQEKEEALAHVDAACTILNKYPAFDTTNTSLSYNVTTNPFQLLMDLFKRTAGYDAFLNMISYYISFATPVLEVTVKTILLSRIKNLLTCSVNPFITRELLENGIVFDLKNIDVMQILQYSPKDGPGRYYYFGCDGFEYPKELAKAGDFNAFLWHTKNNSLRREVWYGANIMSTLITNWKTEYSSDSVVTQKEPKDNPPDRNEAVDKGDGKKKLKKCKKSDGIITLRYSERPSGLRNSVGDAATFLQTPHNNCLQVFLGNVQESEPNLAHFENRLNNVEKEIADLETEIKNHNEELSDVNKRIEDLEQSYKDKDCNKEYYETETKALSKERSQIEANIKRCDDAIATKIPEKQTCINEIKLILSGQPRYRTIEQNYYYNRTLIEFNTDYIMSLKLFDAKVMTAQLIDALTSCLAINLNLSYEQLLVKYELRNMVRAIVESDDVVVSDCFFTFSNTEYDKMLQKAELTREGLYAMDGQNPTGAKIDAESILSSLNGINEGASQETVQSIIEGSLREISAMVSDPQYSQSGKLHIGAQFSFIENLLDSLAYSIMMAILSPKLYLLLAVNLELLGQNRSFNINDFIDMHRQMITELLRAVRDSLLQFLTDKLKLILGDLATEVAIKLTAEQAAYYVRLITRLIECFKRNRNSIDFKTGDINYADILEQTEEPVDNDC